MRSCNDDQRAGIAQWALMVSVPLMLLIAIWDARITADFAEVERAAAQAMPHPLLAPLPPTTHPSTQP
jgi:hypothetical protein